MIGRQETGTPLPERVIASLGSPERGDSLIVVGALHGNEPAGFEACRRVAEALASREADIDGRVTFVTGNRSALARGRRFIDRDLNRAWTTPIIERIRRDGPGSEVEDREQADLIRELDELVATSTGTTYLLDLHTTSALGGAFSTVADSLPARQLALHLPVPLVLGLEEMVDGTLHDWIGEHGVITIAFESGQHDEVAAADRAEAAIWLVIEATGLVHSTHLAEAQQARKDLARDSTGLPPALEMRYRHPVRPGDGFVMAPGWQNFQPVRKGETLAEDADGPVRAPERGRMLMPLYQEQGEDGFFIVREFSAFWLWVSEALRRAGFARGVHLLPGIRKHPEREGVFVVNRRVARWYALQVLHLLGFRRVREEGDQLVVERRGVHYT
ncbi:MAG TPA: succinylglutamate desuccinylase/aspartoacylase family protein [Longimicrobiales bacterium]|nr:succinylglutamate desuccinylase/aspartoacylase family protein [Longimicrobiales bacterium]